MLDYIEWYLVELEHAARKTLSKEEVTELQGEIRAHLTESAASFVCEGIAKEEAARIAVKEIGSVHDLLDRNPKKRWTIFWCSLAMVPLYVLAMELAENGVVAEYGFFLMLLVAALMVVTSYKTRVIQVLPLLCAPVMVFVFTALFLPAWFVDLGELDGHGFVSRFDLYMGLYEGKVLAEINADNRGFTYWQQFGAFLPSAGISAAFMFGIAGFTHLLGVYIRRIVEWRTTRRLQMSLR